MEGAAVDAIARILRSGEPSLILLGGKALRAEALQLAGRIAAKTGARLMAPTSNARMARGAGRVALDRVPYPVDQALAVLKDFRHVILVSAGQPVAFFGYPGKPSVLTSPGCCIHTLAAAHHNVPAALAALADAVGAAKVPPPASDAVRPGVPTGGAIAPDAIAAMLGSLLPADAIVCDESVTTGRGFFPRRARPRPTTGCSSREAPSASGSRSQPGPRSHVLGAR